jgi:hypothetical protein
VPPKPLVARWWWCQKTWWWRVDEVKWPASW